MKPTRSRLAPRFSSSAIALPMLDAMTPALAAGTRAGKAPVRLVFAYVPNGIIMKDWTPKTVGAGFELPRILTPLKSFRDDFMMLSGLADHNGNELGDGAGDHARAGASFLTGVHCRKTAGADIHNGVSADQIAAHAFASQTRFPSLELGCEEGVQGGSCDNGYSCAYSNSISWRTPSSPMPAEIRPRAVFERLFGAAVSDPRAALYEKSILDLVAADAQRLNVQLGGADKRKLDEYLFAIRDLEKRIGAAAKSDPVRRPSMAAPQVGIPADFSEHARIMLDLMTLAFQTDSTRVATLLLALEQSPRAYPEIGIPEAHHGLTHHQGDKGKIEKVTQINCYHAKQFVYLLEKLRSTPDGDGSLLDHSMITYGSGLSDGNAHDHANLPLVLAGRACGTLKSGRFLQYPRETPMANLYVAMLDRMGVPVDSLGDSNGEAGYLSDL